MSEENKEKKKGQVEIDYNFDTDETSDEEIVPTKPVASNKEGEDTLPQEESDDNIAVDFDIKKKQDETETNEENLVVKKVQGKKKKRKPGNITKFMKGSEPPTEEKQGETQTTSEKKGKEKEKEVEVEVEVEEKEKEKKNKNPTLKKFSGPSKYLRLLTPMKDQKRNGTNGLTFGLRDVNVLVSGEEVSGTICHPHKLKGKHISILHIYGYLMIVYNDNNTLTIPSNSSRLMKYLLNNEKGLHGPVKVELGEDGQEFNIMAEDIKFNSCLVGSIKKTINYVNRREAEMLIIEAVKKMKSVGPHGFRKEGKIWVDHVNFQDPEMSRCIFPGEDSESSTDLEERRKRSKKRRKRRRKEVGSPFKKRKKKKKIRKEHDDSDGEAVMEVDKSENNLLIDDALIERIETDIKEKKWSFKIKRTKLEWIFFTNSKKKNDLFKKMTIEDYLCSKLTENK